MTPALETVDVEPVGYREARGIICGRLDTVRIPTYPADAEAEGQRVRMLRAPLGLREAARALGVSAVWLSDVECGRRRLVDLDAALATLRAAYGAAAS